MNEPTITLTGNATGEIDLRYTPNGKPVARLMVACNPRRLDSTSNTWIDGTPSFWPCEVWGPMAENLADSITKGDRVTLTGRVRAQVWTPTDGENAGTEQRRIDVIVDEIGPSLRFRSARPVKAVRGSATAAASEESGWDTAGARS
jgi:single-strand DNA-binding protein